VVADFALVTIGGALKRKEMISARLGDILSELYLLSAVLKRFKDEGRQEADLPLVAWCMETGCATIEQRFDEVLRNFPSRALAALGRMVVLPAGVTARGPDDATVRACAEVLTEPSEARERLTAGVHCGDAGAVRDLEEAYARVVAVAPLRRRLKEAKADGIEEGLAKGLVSEEEAARLREAEAAVARVVAVDDFAAEELSPYGRRVEAAQERAGPGATRETG
jgi:acyl-CoA dehydrogenase